MLSACTILASAPWLADLGFSRSAANEWANDGLRLGADGGWLTVRCDETVVVGTSESRRARRAPRDGRGPHGGPCDAQRLGPWKRCRGAVRFDAPLAAIAARSDSIDGVPEPQDLARALVQWAMDTRPGATAGPWQPPGADRLGRIVLDAALSFRAGTLLEPARLLRGDATLGLRVGLGRLNEASAARLGWLDRFLLDAGALRMVRVERGDGAVEAHVDLTGAPLEFLDGILAVALDVLRHAFVLLAPTATVLADGRWRSSVLETPQPKGGPS